MQTLADEPEESIRVLFIEDNPGDARLVQETLKENNFSNFDIVHADCMATALSHFAETYVSSPPIQFFLMAKNINSRAAGVILVPIANPSERPDSALFPRIHP